MKEEEEKRVGDTNLVFSECSVEKGQDKRVYEEKELVVLCCGVFTAKLAFYFGLDLDLDEVKLII